MLEPWMLNEVDLVSLLVNGLPPPSYFGKDWQSDKEAARVFSPGYVRSVHWDSYGACLYMFFTSLTTGLSLSSKLWQGRSVLFASKCNGGVLLDTSAHCWEVGWGWEWWEVGQSFPEWGHLPVSHPNDSTALHALCQLASRCPLCATSTPGGVHGTAFWPC